MQAGPSTTVSWGSVFPNDVRAGETYLDLAWNHEVQFFVGGNGSGKSRTAQAVVSSLRTAGHISCHLATDRLAGMMSFSGYTWNADPETFKGSGLDPDTEQRSRSYAEQKGFANDVAYVLREHPEVRLRLSALLRRAFGRSLDLVEQSGFVDPIVRSAIRQDLAFGKPKDMAFVNL